MASSFSLDPAVYILGCRGRIVIHYLKKMKVKDQQPQTTPHNSQLKLDLASIRHHNQNIGKPVHKKDIVRCNRSRRIIWNCVE